MEDLFKILLVFLASISALFPDSLWGLVVRPWLTSEADHSGGSVSQRVRANSPATPFDTG